MPFTPSIRTTEPQSPWRGGAQRLAVVFPAHPIHRSIVQGASQYVRSQPPGRVALDLVESHRVPPATTWDVDATIWTVPVPTEVRRKLVRRGVPCVVTAPVHQNLGPCCVQTDDVAIGRLAADHLLDRGFRDIAYCGARGVAFAARRGVGARAATAERGGRFHEIEVVPVPRLQTRTSRRLDRQLRQWLESLPLPSGIICCIDVYARTVLEVADQIGLRVPDQVAVVGVGNDDLFCETCTPSLSSVETNLARVGFEAASLAHRQVDGTADGNSSLLVAPLGVIPRTSTDITTAADPLVAKAMSLIRSHAHEALKVADVAVHMGVSRRLLERRFQAALRRTPHEMIAVQRLECARTQLLASNQTIEAVALACGFDSGPHLAATFRRAMGMTPSAFRRQHRL